MISLTLITALLIDRIIGEPKRWHPLVGFGNLATCLERYFNTKPSSHFSIIIGGICFLALVSPFVVLCFFITKNMAYSYVVSIFILYWAIGHQSLREHINIVKNHLINNDVEQAQQSLSMIVSRQTEGLDQTQIVQATIETGLENGSDAIFAPIFWFCLFGIPGVVTYRLCNTLDAMWGYRNEQFNYFGRCAARCDDVLNFIPARLVALSYALLGNTKSAMYCLRTQSKTLKSPNAGPVMTAGAGSLHIKLGGPAYYHGKLMQKPIFGSGSLAKTKDIDRSLTLIFNTLALWCLAIIAIELVIHYI